MNKHEEILLRTLTRTLCEIGKYVATTNPSLCDVDLENYSDSYKWLPLPVRDEYSGTVSDLILSEVEHFPNDCLAGILLAILKNQVPNGISMDAMSIDRVGNSFCFCISGSTSLEELQNLCEQYRLNHDFADKR